MPTLPALMAATTNVASGKAIAKKAAPAAKRATVPVTNVSRKRAAVTGPAAMVVTGAGSMT